MHKENMTFEEVFNDSDFRNIVERKIEKLYNQYRNRPEPKVGFRYKRNAIDILVRADQFNTTYFINNIIDIWNKKSNLPLRERTIIKHICDAAIIEYLTPKE